jgi:hypothetical protein
MVIIHPIGFLSLPCLLGQLVFHEKLDFALTTSGTEMEENK